MWVIYFIALTVKQFDREWLKGMACAEFLNERLKVIDGHDRLSSQLVQFPMCGPQLGYAAF